MVAGRFGNPGLLAMTYEVLEILNRAHFSSGTECVGCKTRKVSEKGSVKRGRDASLVTNKGEVEMEEKLTGFAWQ
jgi:hypothetical protein